MNSEDKTEIVNALIAIKTVLSLYNNILDNGQGYTDKDYDDLSKAFDGVKAISTVIKNQ